MAFHHASRLKAVLGPILLYWCTSGAPSCKSGEGKLLPKLAGIVFGPGARKEAAETQGTYMAFVLLHKSFMWHPCESCLQFLHVDFETLLRVFRSEVLDQELNTVSSSAVPEFTRCSSRWSVTSLASAGSPSKQLRPEDF